MQEVLRNHDKGIPQPWVKRLREHLFFIIGFFLIVLMGALYVGNGGNVPVVPHDQLDDQVPAYEMAVKHWGSAFYPEFMGGQSSSTMAISVPGMLIFYRLLPSVTAFAINLLFAMVVAYVSLYGSLRLLGVRDSVGTLVALSFALLPFYSVYGSSSMGVPLMLCALILSVRDRRIVLPSVLCIAYAAFSSLVWVGFAVCFTLLLIALFYLIRGSRAKALRVAALLAILVLAYVLLNAELLSSVFGSGVEGHRLEFVLNAEPFSLKAVYNFFLEGQYHSVSNQYYLAVADIAIIATVGLWVLARKHSGKLSRGIKSLIRGACIGVVAAFCIAVFEVAFHSGAIIELRDMLPGSLRSFQFDRFYWLYPCIWYVTTGLSFESLIRVGTLRNNVVLSWMVVCLTVGLTLNVSLPHNIVYINAKAMATNGQSSQITWDEFYAEDLFEDIKADIEETSDGNKAVISIGLHPSVALHNGLTTLDGYSNNYPLEYKHEFGRIIQGELDKSESLSNYYWGWGSRCYAFSHELGQSYVIPKGSGITLKDFSMDVDALKEMGGGYIVSAVPIDQLREHGLEEIGHYDTSNSYYELWLYRIV